MRFNNIWQSETFANSIFFLFQNISGTTYPNQCSLDCAREVNPGNSLLALCPTTGPTVCATDTVTYPNQCRLNCAIKLNESLSACDTAHTVLACYHNGATQALSGIACQIECTARLNTNIHIDCPAGDAVCIRDLAAAPGTYFAVKTSCDYTCISNRNNFNFNVQLEANQVCTNDCKGKCPITGTQVCGSNGITYNNTCNFQCDYIFNRTLTKKCDLACANPLCTTP